MSSDNLEYNRLDFAGDNVVQKRLIEEQLQRAFAPALEGVVSDMPSGWGSVAHLVMYWLKYPDRAPQPPTGAARSSTPQGYSHGCICPAGAEAGCRGWACPRRPMVDLKNVR